MEKWVVKAKKADFQKIGVDFHIDPVIARLIRNRDVIGYDAMEEYLHGDLKNLADVYVPAEGHRKGCGASEYRYL